jgi:hypothetical protein
MTTPHGLDPTITRREVVFTVDVEGVTPSATVLNGQPLP